MADQPSTTPAPPPPSGNGDLRKFSPFEVLKARPGGSASSSNGPQGESVKAAEVPVGSSSAVPIPPAQASTQVAPSPAVSGQPSTQISPPVAPSREELIKQAAEAPASSFVLPSPNFTPPPAKQSPSVAKPASGSTGSTPPPALRPQGSSANSSPSIPSAPPAPAAEKPTVVNLNQSLSGGVSDNQFLKPPIPPQAPQSATPPPSPGKPPFAPPVQAGASKSGLRALLLLIAVVVIVGSGAAFLLALSGRRVPFVYSLLSGLPAAGSEVVAEAQEYVGGRQQYAFTGEVQVQEQGGSVSGVPVIGGISAGSVYALHRTLEIASYSNQDGKFLASGNVTVNDDPQLPVALITEQSSSNRGTSWQAVVAPGETPEIVSINKDQAHKTLLAAVLAPVPLSKILESLSEEQEYQKFIGDDGIASAAYQFTVNGNALQGSLPEGAKFEQGIATLRFSWKKAQRPAAQPLSAALKGVLSYQGKQYDYTGSWSYIGWDQPLNTAADSGLALLSSGASVPRGVQVGDFAGQLGILSLEALPNTLGTTVAEEPGTVVPSPTPTPSPTSTVITPTGETTTSTGGAISPAPPVPTQPASEAALARDVQRLRDLGDLQSALEKYRTERGNYPSTGGRLEQTADSKTLLDALVPKYITAMPVDPMRTTYWYEYRSDGSTYRLRSVAENVGSVSARKGTTYSYYEVTN